MTDTSTTETETTAVVRRRITWEQFYKLRPDLRPANDNEKRAAKAPQRQVAAAGAVASRLEGNRVATSGNSPH